MLSLLGTNDIEMQSHLLHVEIAMPVLWAFKSRTQVPIAWSIWCEHYMCQPAQGPTSRETCSRIMELFEINHSCEYYFSKRFN